MLLYTGTKIRAIQSTQPKLPTCVLKNNLPTLSPREKILNKWQNTDRLDHIYQVGFLWDWNEVWAFIGEVLKVFEKEQLKKEDLK